MALLIEITGTVASWASKVKVQDIGLLVIVLVLATGVGSGVATSWRWQFPDHGSFLIVAGEA